MDNYICTTCGVQQKTTKHPPEECAVCIDERQFINPNGQTWTTLAEMAASHTNIIREIEPRLTGIATEPSFAIGQRALLVQTDQGNILWDCISYIDDATIEAVHALGGIQGIAISHPHFYDSMVDWSHAFDRVPIHLNAADREWVMRPDPVIQFWQGETKRLNDEITLIHCGGHFPGATALHWASGAVGLGALLVGDTMVVAADLRYVSFMYSYPNRIPLGAAAIRNIVEAVAPFQFARLYSGWWEQVVTSDGKAAVERSAARYLRAIG